MEDYLPGVVVAELFNHWRIETRAAQAIAARSFAASEHQWFRSRREWDVTNTAHSQVYRGRTDHGPSLEAVEMTRGVVLGFKGGLVPGYYSSCCGGIAANALDAIGSNPINDMRPLTGRSGQDVCTSKSIARWTIDRDVPRLTKRLATWGRRGRRSNLGDLEQVATIEPTARNEHGRPTRYAVGDTTGRTVELSAERLRRAANFSGDGMTAPQRRLWSSHVKVTIRDGTASFAGQGIGHGVGLCQYGAETLARAGTGHDEILRWYYPDVRVVNAY
jgi:stage II sporulation protein D